MRLRLEEYVTTFLFDLSLFYVFFLSCCVNGSIASLSNIKPDFSYTILIFYLSLLLLHAGRKSVLLGWALAINHIDALQREPLNLFYLLISLP